jgi:integrase/recombinase XerD
MFVVNLNSTNMPRIAQNVTLYVKPDKRYPKIDKHKPDDEPRYPVRIFVTHKRKSKCYTLGFYMTFEEFAEKTNPKTRKDEYRSIQEKIKLFIDKASDIIKELGEDFSLEAFERIYVGEKRQDTNDLLGAMANRASMYRKEGRISTARACECAMNSLKEYTGKQSLKFELITSKFLNDYELYLTSTPRKSQREVQLLVKRKVKIKDKEKEERTEKVRSITTVGFYMRIIKVVVMAAIEGGVMKNNPFGKKKYQIPAGRKSKKALSLEQVGRLFNYKAMEGSPEEKWRDMWIFSYLANGMNINDIARLKFENISIDSIVFVRQKTKRTTRTDRREVIVPLTPSVGRILDKHAKPNGYPGDYIFSILRHGMTPEQEYAAIHQAIKLINKYIDRIAKVCDIPLKVTSYTARHSFATILKLSGAPIELISDALSHQDTNTTKNYLGDFENSALREAYKALTDFPQNNTKNTEDLLT